MGGFIDKKTLKVPYVDDIEGMFMIFGDSHRDGMTIIIDTEVKWHKQESHYIEE